MNRTPIRDFLHRLDPDSWSRINSILDEVFDLPPDQLGPALARLCGGDRDMEAQIRSILAVDTAVEGYLSRTARMDLILDPLDQAQELPVLDGRKLGPWRVLHPIARGGMGVVYLGERADGAFEQRVAIKLLGRGIASAALLARFQQERQILARLEHPNIARLVDGGVTEDGLWWFAMEYVDGSPITEWCASRRASTRSVLGLFQQACRAVQYAHRNLVVHRDLKPGNILVSRAGEVKLLDFGIAKILEDQDRPGVDRSTVTTAAMTPNYAAPEQIRGEPPSTATDIYALGVVLYELLTGERPYRVKTGLLADMRRAVLEEEPESPSARVRRLQKRESREVSGARSDRPRADAHRVGAGRPPVPRELDAIVLTALRKEPERRYSSVEALVEDIQRHLDGRAVRASGRTFGYVAGKFIRRNRVPVAAGVLVLVALVAGLYITSRERNRARQEAARATELKEFALSLFRVSDPEVGGGASITARELLDRGATRVDRELRGDPRLQAEMWDLLGSVYRSLDLFPPAIAMYQKSVAARRAHPERPDTLLASSLRELGSALDQNGDYAGAERTLREALAIERSAFGDTHPRVARTLAPLAQVHEDIGDFAESESLYRQAIRIDSLALGMSSRETAGDLANLGMHYYYDGRYRDAIPYIARALAIRQRLLGRDHWETALGLDQLGMALAGIGKADSGITLMREALAIRRRVLPPDHLDIAYSLANLGSELGNVGRLDEADRDMRVALAMRVRSLDRRDPLLAHTHNDLAVVLYREGLLDSAAVHFQEALRIWSYSLPPNHASLLTCRNNLAVVYRETGRYGEAERLFRALLSEYGRQEAPDHLGVASTEYHLGRLLVMIGRAAEAEPLLHHAEASRRAVLQEDDPRVAEIRLTLGNALFAMGRTQEGRALIRDQIGNAEKRLGSKDRMVAMGLRSLGGSPNIRFRAAGHRKSRPP